MIIAHNPFTEDRSTRFSYWRDMLFLPAVDDSWALLNWEGNEIDTSSSDWAAGFMELPVIMEFWCRWRNGDNPFSLTEAIVNYNHINIGIRHRPLPQPDVEDPRRRFFDVMQYHNVVCRYCLQNEELGHCAHIHTNDTRSSWCCRDCQRDLVTCTVCGERTFVVGARNRDAGYFSDFNCESCEISREEVYDEDDNGVIDPRPNISDDDGNIIHGYNYRPEFAFRNANGTIDLGQPRDRDHPFFSFELEVEMPHEDDIFQGATFINDVGDGFLYCKMDGSLSNGFEVVTHPFAWDWMKDDNNYNKYIKPIFDLKDMGFLSYDRKSCGMHTHVSLAGFTNFQLFKLMNLVFNDLETTRILAQRTKSQMENWCRDLQPSMRNYVTQEQEQPSPEPHGDEYGIRLLSDPDIPESERAQRAPRDGDFTYRAVDNANMRSKQQTITNLAKSKGSCGGDRYVAINITNGSTVEFRFCRGTLNEVGFMKNLELAHAMYSFTKEDISLKEVSMQNLIGYVYENRAMYENLFAFIVKSRRLESLKPAKTAKEIRRQERKKKFLRKRKRLIEKAREVNFVEPKT